MEQKLSFAEASRLRVKHLRDKQSILESQMVQLKEAFPEFYQELEAWRTAHGTMIHFDEQITAEIHLKEKYKKLDEMLEKVMQTAPLRQLGYGCDLIQRNPLSPISTLIPSALYFSFTTDPGVVLYMNALPGSDKEYLALDIGLQVISEDAYSTARSTKSDLKLASLSLAHFSNASSRNSSIFEHHNPNVSRFYSQLTTLAAGCFQGVRNIMINTIRDGYQDLFLKEEEIKTAKNRDGITSSGHRMRRFAGMMPADEVERSEVFVDSNDLRIRIDAGPNGWVIRWADMSSTYADESIGTDANFKNAFDTAESTVGKLTPYSSTPKEDVEK